MVGAGKSCVNTTKSICPETGPPESTCAVQVYPPSDSCCVQDHVCPEEPVAVHVCSSRVESIAVTITRLPARESLRPEEVTVPEVWILACRASHTAGEA